MAESDEHVGWSFLRSKRWFGYYALIVVFAIACVFLGNWQFDRRAQAQAEIARIDRNYDAAPVAIEEALPTLDAFHLDRNKWQQVRLTGTYIDEPYLVRNRPSQQGVGALIVQPFELDNGNVFIVDRGWVDVNAADGIPATLPTPAPGRVELVVRLRESEPPVPGRTDVGRALGSLHLDALAERIDAPMYTGAYGQLVSESPAGSTGLLPDRPERDEGPHLSYALQWYVFIFIALGGAWYAARLEYRALNPEATRAHAEAKRLKEQRRHRPRRMSDAEEEDAFLDGQITPR